MSARLHNMVGNPPMNMSSADATAMTIGPRCKAGATNASKFCEAGGPWARAMHGYVIAARSSIFRGLLIRIRRSTARHQLSSPKVVNTRGSTRTLDPDHKLVIQTAGASCSWTMSREIRATHAAALSIAQVESGPESCAPDAAAKPRERTREPKFPQAAQTAGFRTRVVSAIQFPSKKRATTARRPQNRSAVSKVRSGAAAARIPKPTPPVSPAPLRAEIHSVPASPPTLAKSLARSWTSLLSRSLTMPFTVSSNPASAFCWARTTSPIALRACLSDGFRKAAPLQSSATKRRHNAQTGGVVLAHSPPPCSSEAAFSFPAAPRAGIKWPNLTSERRGRIDRMPTTSPARPNRRTISRTATMSVHCCA
mmetsp:Transcript_43073/g.88678  ORF Transcript_43073/g.88678 Transcript_43073/m.88678 type:complete len:367 (+) Transcript_43073:83-1183(+)